MTPREIKTRLEYLRGELRAERISTAELCELENLSIYIEPGDVELLEPAGVPEYTEDDPAAMWEARAGKLTVALQYMIWHYAGGVHDASDLSGNSQTDAILRQALEALKTVNRKLFTH